MVVLVGILVVADGVLANFVINNRPSTPALNPRLKAVSQHNNPPVQPATTEGQPPTPIPGDPEQELWNPNGREDFSTANNWTGFDNDYLKSEVTSGQFAMTTKAKLVSLVGRLSGPVSTTITY